MDSPPRYETPRRDPRFSLHLPVTVSLRSEKPRQIKAQSDNISVRGILFSAHSPIPIGSEVDIEVYIAAVSGRKPTSLASIGKVLRVTQPRRGEFQMAVGCDGPFDFVEREKSELP